MFLKRSILTMKFIKFDAIVIKNLIDAAGATFHIAPAASIVQKFIIAMNFFLN
jgi:hypothetical protein